jgi:acyl-CoA reductase-like NAD-dependent aldehyde dehydrogenase
MAIVREAPVDIDVPGTRPPREGGRRRLALFSPVDDAPVGEFDCAGPAEVAEAVARAREAQVAWGRASFEARAEVMRRALQVVLRRQDDILAVVMRETGRSRMESTVMEIFPACDSLNFHAKRAKKILADRRVGLHLLRHKRARIVYRPLGVVGIITPWNGPFIMVLNPTVQALMAGNAVIVKPSEVTPFSGRMVAEVFEEAGLPPGLLQVLLGDGATGAALVNGGVDKISFTGSVATGRKIGEACGRQLVPCTLELGGKDPMIVCADADLERAAGGAVFGAFMNNGQFCSSTERVYVHEAVADEFTARVVEKTRALTVGGPEDGLRDIGPFIAAHQIEIVERQVADAVAAGAKALTGGRRAEHQGRYFYEPTVLTDVTHQMAVMREETFGPVLPIMRVPDERSAIALANDCDYGLGATVWTKDKQRGEQIARQLVSGSVCVNDSSVIYGALELPFGGRRASGVGAVNGEAGLRGYCHAQPILTDRLGLKEEQVWYPYSEEKLTGLQKAIHWLWGTPLRKLLG